MELIVESSEECVISRLWGTIEKLAAESIARDNVFRIGLSGGSLIKYLAAGADTCTTDWTKWQLFFCDERYVPEEDEDSTFGQYRKLFLPKTGLKLSQFATIDTARDLKDCAHAYEQKIYRSFGIQDVRFYQC